jgi:hypothetical protein
MFSVVPERISGRVQSLTRGSNVRRCAEVVLTAVSCGRDEPDRRNRSLWRQVAGSPNREEVGALDNRAYHLRVTADYVPGSENILVTLTLARRALMRRSLMRQPLVVPPDNTFSA